MCLTHTLLICTSITGKVAIHAHFICVNGQYQKFPQGIFCRVRQPTSSTDLSGSQDFFFLQYFPAYCLLLIRTTFCDLEIVIHLTNGIIQPTKFTKINNCIVRSREIIVNCFYSKRLNIQLCIAYLKYFVSERQIETPECLVKIDEKSNVFEN